MVVGSESNAIADIGIDVEGGMAVGSEGDTVVDISIAV